MISPVIKAESEGPCGNAAAEGAEGIAGRFIAPDNAELDTGKVAADGMRKSMHLLKKAKDSKPDSLLQKSPPALSLLKEGKAAEAISQALSPESEAE